MRYYNEYTSYAARRILSFKKVGEKSHIQGEGHSIVFYKNYISGECAIRVIHPSTSQLWVFENAKDANEYYKNVMKL